MERAAESASLTAAQKQKAYGDYFNKRSCVKNFSIGEQVVLLIPDSSNKIYARWTEPGEIIQHHPPHSNKVNCPMELVLNSESVSDDFPMEDAVELIHSIGRTNIITTLDLWKGYWAIPMAEDSKTLTPFKTHRQQYGFQVMSFGLKNASATFQMNKALSCYREFSRAYIEDIAIFSKNWGEHLHLDTILTNFSELNFTVSIKKFVFGKTQIKYLGHIIGSGKHEPDPEKTAVINNLPVPKTKKELRSVLGLCNYYREYIPKYSELVYPLTELTKKRVPDSIPFTEKHDSSFKVCDYLRSTFF
ncbi:retrovirus-related Pol polyprotein from transposon 17.6 [Trichonephila clavipes]|uniref:Retrovirus-related Pol polyprotein from transposon 17.6 n=1 Tax=Trichonephila clavipes TaxID=2585209 RepID=A0A8X6SQU5_TRICX|nr:retrovirus-related Pol polyprotein from transposon 17.6 [Trichonephila clavipes]